MKSRIQFLVFSLSGVIGLIVDLAALYLASQVMNLYTARLVSFLAAVISTWLLNRTFTFKVSSTVEQANINPNMHLILEFIQYLIANISGGLVNLAFYSTYISFNVEPIDKYIAVCLGSISGLLLNFTLSKFFIFKK